MEGLNTMPFLVITLLILVFILMSIGIVYSYLKDKKLDDIRGDV